MTDDDDMTRVPGLYRAWDLGALIEQGHVWRIEDAGWTGDGQPLFAVFQARVDPRPEWVVS